MATSAANPEEQLFAGELRRLVEASIDALPDAYRSVFVLRVLEGMSPTSPPRAPSASTSLAATASWTPGSGS